HAYSRSVRAILVRWIRNRWKENAGDGRRETLYPSVTGQRREAKNRDARVFVRSRGEGYSDYRRRRAFFDESRLGNRQLRMPGLLGTECRQSAVQSLRGFVDPRAL